MLIAIGGQRPFVHFLGMRFRHFVFVSLLISGSSLWAAESKLEVSYGAEHKEILSADLAKLPVAEIDAVDHGQSHHYHGVAVRDLLALVNAPLGEKLRGPAVGLVVRVRASDGYVGAFALAEFDPAFRDSTILLVDSEDGKPLHDSAGPFRLVCPGDKRGARWIRKVESIEVISIASESKPTT